MRFLTFYIYIYISHSAKNHHDIESSNESLLVYGYVDLIIGSVDSLLILLDTTGTAMVEADLHLKCWKDCKGCEM